MALTSMPSAPLVGDVVTITLAGARGDHLELDLSGRPHESRLPLGRLRDAAGRAVTSFMPDAAGRYELTAFDVRRFVTGASYEGDPLDGRGHERLLGTEAGAVVVCSTLELPIRASSGEGATLRIAADEARVVRAALIEPTSDGARIATLGATVTTAVAALVGVPLESLGPPLPWATANLIAAYEQHRGTLQNAQRAPVHATRDTSNAVLAAAPASMLAAVGVLNELRDRLLGHLMSGAIGGTWHFSDDTLNLPVAGKATTAAQAIVLYADLRVRVLERHLAQVSAPRAHGSADNLTPLTPLDSLSAVVAALFDALPAQCPPPPAPPGESEGVVVAAHRYGFERVG